MIHRDVSFKIDLLGLSSWRWTIEPRSQSGFTCIGTAYGTYDEAVAHCKAEIDALLARESGTAET
jgi:hypothetical protein